MDLCFGLCLFLWTATKLSWGRGANRSPSPPVFSAFPLHTDELQYCTKSSSNTHIINYANTAVLGVCMADNLSWDLHTSSLINSSSLPAVVEEGPPQSTHHDHFQFYKSTIESVPTNSISLCFENHNATERQALSKVDRIAERTIGTTLPTIQELALKRCMSKAKGFTFEFCI